MIPRTVEQNKQLYSLLNEKRLLQVKGELVESFSDGRTSKSSELSYDECDRLIRHLRYGMDPLQNARRKVLSLAHDLGWETPDGKIDWKVLNAWLESPKCKAGKLLNDQDAKELVTTAQQLRYILTKDYERHRKNEP